MEDQISDASIVYRLRPADVAAHLFQMTCRIDTPDPAGQRVYLPAWIPGSYLVRDYARHILSLQASGPGGPVAVHKIDKATWQVEPVNGPLLLSAEIYANDLSVRGAFLDSRHAFVNGVCVFPTVAGHEGARCVVHIEAPADETQWEVATALQRLSGVEGGFGAFTAASYDELIDCPVLMGPLVRASFEVAGVPHTFSLVGKHDADLDRLAEDAATICATHADMFGGLPMPAYQFLVTVLNHGYGGLEHCDSSALVCSRHDLPRPGETGVSERYRKFLGLVSHEYFHLWNVKRIRPAELTPYDLQSENYTRQLWLFEGITSYYDDLGLLRSGLIGADSYLELLGRTLTRVYRSGGRRRQTLEESSFDAWIKFYRQDENSPNALVSYYAKGAMVALALDLELRLRTDGLRSLDSVMRELWKVYGTAGQGVPDGAFERLAEEVSGVRLDEFFHQALRTTVDPPVGILLAQFGVRLVLRGAEGAADKGGRPGKREAEPLAWLGLDTRQHGERLMIRHVLTGGPAHAAGLSAGDQLLALNGERLDARRLKKALAYLPLEQDASVHVFRRDDLLETRLRPVRAPRDTAYLCLDDAADAASLARREAWLGA
ncbi:MAG: M61 family metallopeptidase [Chromatiales bacterium]|nr:MAG: M61 family metallopeptidase [Chromatiales bacterium]